MTRSLHIFVETPPTQAHVEPNETWAVVREEVPNTHGQHRVKKGDPISTVEAIFFSAGDADRYLAWQMKKMADGELIEEIVGYHARRARLDGL